MCETVKMSLWELKNLKAMWRKASRTLSLLCRAQELRHLICECTSAAGWLLRIYSTRPGATAAEKLRKSPVSLTWTGEGKVIRHLLVGINQNSVTLATENS